MPERSITPQVVESWKTIYIPKEEIRSETGPTKSDLIINVQPLDDTWLLNKDRTPEEIDYLLEGRLQEIQLDLQSYADSPTAQRYGITRPVGGQIERFIAYAELVDEYRLKEESHGSKAVSLRAQLDAEKESINNQVSQREITKGKSRQIIHGVASRYAGQMNLQRGKGNEARRVQDLIARKFVLEYLSTGQDPDNLLITYLPSIIHQSVELGSDQENASSPVYDLIQNISEYLNTTKDPYIFNNFHYHNTQGLTSTQADMNTIQAIQNMNFNPDFYSENTQVQLAVRTLGQGMINFLRRKAIFKSQQPQLGENLYPVLTLLFDLANTTLASGSPKLNKDMAGLLNNHFVDYVQSPLIAQEIKQLVKNYNDLVNNTALQTSSEESKIKMQRSHILDEIIQLMISREWRLLHGLSIGNRRFFSGNAMYTESSLLNRVSNAFRAEEQRVGVKLPLKHLKSKEDFERKVKELQSTHGIYKKQGIEADISDRAGLDVLDYDHSESVKDKVSSMSSKEKFAELKSIDADIKINGEAAYDLLQASYFLHFWSPEFFSDEATTILEKYDRENRYLWGEIQDNLKWFVSPRGDRYNSADDPLLQGKGLDGLTFRIDKAHPHEFIVDLTVSGINTPLRFWLDRNRNLKDKNRGVVKVDSAGKTAFTNAILKRLYYITSGLLSQESEGEEDRDIDSLNLTYRRAHYTTLNSTDRRPITMTSHGALIHAREVLEGYGIDIFAEIARRRRIGRLLPHQYLTFTREVSPEVTAKNVVPNIIKFDPNAVGIPLTSE